MFLHMYIVNHPREVKSKESNPSVLEGKEGIEGGEVKKCWKSIKLIDEITKKRQRYKDKDEKQ